MLNLGTGKFLRNGLEICIGDKLKGRSTHEVVVVYDEDLSKFIVGIVEERLKDFWFDLDEFLNSWNDLEVTGSIVKRKKSNFISK